MVQLNHLLGIGKKPGSSIIGVRSVEARTISIIRGSDHRRRHTIDTTPILVRDTKNNDLKTTGRPCMLREKSIERIFLSSENP